MTTAAATPRSGVLGRRRLFAPDAVSARGRTLEDLVVAALEERRFRGTASCLVCGEDVDAGGVCGRCGSELS